MNIGDRVRVKSSVVIYHHPEQRQKAFEIKGLEGEIAKIMTDRQGRKISPNLPILVKFPNRFKAHLKASELEVI